MGEEAEEDIGFGGGVLAVVVFVGEEGASWSRPDSSILVEGGAPEWGSLYSAVGVFFFFSS